ncbi:MAG: hypothetical protein Q7S65_01655 [Nanoarchaeota archaeon]|nr:hypothetical protein [Nanoarchaeota archaeon]
MACTMDVGSSIVELSARMNAITAAMLPFCTTFFVEKSRMAYASRKKSSLKKITAP